MVAVIIAVPAVPIVRPVIAVVAIRSVVGIAIRIVVSIGVISVIAWASDPNREGHLSVRTLRGNESQYPCHQSN